MRLEDAMLYCLVNEGRGLTVPQLTYLINREKLHIKKNGTPISEDEVWACYFRNRHTFIWEGGIIHLLI
ncbi:MAG: hypothetical protein J1F16_01915 [Muribaculaceae bacterium]|nr:hypothetical protein [Muribaculaceae bacterium]